MQKVKSMGMLLDSWRHKSCEATVAVGSDWATIYSILSHEPGKGHATELLLAMKEHYKAQGKVFGSSVALNDRMRFLLTKLNIIEYGDD